MLNLALVIIAFFNFWEHSRLNREKPGLIWDSHLRSLFDHSATCQRDHISGSTVHVVGAYLLSRQDWGVSEMQVRNVPNPHNCLHDQWFPFLSNLTWAIVTSCLICDSSLLPGSGYGVLVNVIDQQTGLKTALKVWKQSKFKLHILKKVTYSILR